MRSSVALIMAFALAAPFLALADLLDDDGFEGAGTIAWMTNRNPDANFTLDLDSIADPRNGDQAFEISWGAAIPQWRVGEAYQEFAVTEYDAYSAEVYAKIATALDNTEAYLETIFYTNSLGGELVGENLQSTKLGAVTDWTLLANEGQVPENAGWAKLRVLVFTSGGESSQGTIYWDDAFANIPEPVTCVMLGMGFAGIIIARRRRKR